MRLIEQIDKSLSFIKYKDNYKIMEHLDNDKNIPSDINIIYKLFTHFLNLKLILYKLLVKFYHKDLTSKGYFKNNKVSNNIPNNIILDGFESEIRTLRFNSHFYINNRMFSARYLYDLIDNVKYNNDLNVKEILSCNLNCIGIKNNNLIASSYSSMNEVVLFSRPCDIDITNITINSKEEALKLLKILNNKGNNYIRSNINLSFKRSHPSCGILEAHGLNEVFLSYNISKFDESRSHVFNLYVLNSYTHEQFLIDITVNSYDVYSYICYLLFMHDLTKLQSSLLLFSTNKNNNENFEVIESWLTTYFSGYELTSISSLNKNSNNNIKTWLYDFNSLTEDFIKKLNE